MKHAFFFIAIAALFSAGAFAQTDKPFYVQVHFSGVPHEKVALKIFWYSQHNTQRSEERTVSGNLGASFALRPYPRRVVVKATRSGCPKDEAGTVTHEFEPPVERVRIDFVAPCP
jgi:hypothetical protein